jgi:pimeloyl-ACP methyl ester carboxylesterase
MIHLYRFEPQQFVSNQTIILYFHGARETVYDIRTNLARLATRLEAPIYALEYPGFGGSDRRTRPAAPLIFQYAKRSLEFLLSTTAHTPPTITLYGSGFGTIVAAQVLCSLPPLIIDAGFLSLVLKNPIIPRVIASNLWPPFSRLQRWLLRSWTHSFDCQAIKRVRLMIWQSRHRLPWQQRQFQRFADRLGASGNILFSNARRDECLQTIHRFIHGPIRPLELSLSYASIVHSVELSAEEEQQIAETSAEEILAEEEEQQIAETSAEEQQIVAETSAEEQNYNEASQIEMQPIIASRVSVSQPFDTAEDDNYLTSHTPAPPVDEQTGPTSQFVSPSSFLQIPASPSGSESHVDHIEETLDATQQQTEQQKSQSSLLYTQLEEQWMFGKQRQDTPKKPKISYIERLQQTKMPSGLMKVTRP